MKKTFVLTVLFILPIVAYLFFASGVNNFGRLPVLTERIDELEVVGSTVRFEDKISVLGFLGKAIDKKKGNAFNLNQKIYKRFFEFEDFQFVMVVPKGVEDAVKELKKELGAFSNIEKWNFVFVEEDKVVQLFDSLDTELELDENLATPHVFIIDKERKLRGRTEDEEEGTKYGFNTTSVADLNNKMVDDVKIILAEYRLALKKNSAERKN